MPDLMMDNLPRDQAKNWGAALDEYRQEQAKHPGVRNFKSTKDQIPIPLPGWNQILQFEPKLPSPTEYTLFVAADLGIIDPNKLDPPTRDAVLKRLDTAHKLRSQNMPEWRSKMVTALTAIDDTQDIVQTLAWLGGPLLDRFGKRGRAAHMGLKKTSDALNFIQDRLRDPRLLRKAKNQYMNDRKRNSRTTTWKYTPKSKAGKWLAANWGNLLTAGQASSSITGIGIQLGAIYGSLEGAIWDDAMQLWRVARIETDKLDLRLGWYFPQNKAKIEKRILENQRDLMNQDKPWVLQTLDYLDNKIQKLGSAFNLGIRPEAMTHIMSDNPLFDIDTHARAITAYNWWLEVEFDTWAEQLDRWDLTRVATLNARPPAVFRPVTEAILKAYGIRVGKNRQATGLAAPPLRNNMAQAKEDADNLIAHQDAWLPKTDDSLSDQYLHSNYNYTAALSGGIISNNHIPLTLENTLDDDLVLFAFDQGSLPPRSADLQQLQAWEKYMKAHAGPDRQGWRRQGFADLNRAYWFKQNRFPTLLTG